MCLCKNPLPSSLTPPKALPSETHDLGREEGWAVPYASC